MRHLSENHGRKESLADIYVETHCSSTWPLCKCGCGTRLEFRGWTRGFADVVRSHQMHWITTLCPERNVEMKRKQSESRMGIEPWCKGLSKDSCPSLAAAAPKIKAKLKERWGSGELVAWNDGKTKHDDPRIMSTSVKLTEKYASGKCIPWAKGETKETDPRLAQMGKTISKVLRESGLNERLTQQKRLDPEEILRRLETHAPDFELLSDLSSDYTRDIHRNLQFKCRCCGTIHTNSLVGIHRGRCPTCGIIGSRAQSDIVKYVKSLGFEDVVANDRNAIRPKELDVYVPSRKFAIEYNGLFYHAEPTTSDKNYHANKTKLCTARGITLFHVFEDEWCEKRAIIESMIAHRLGMSKEKIDARKCQVRSVSSAARKAFFDATHIDGDVQASVAFGLYAGDELVSCISLRTPKHAKHAKTSLEVARYSTKLGTIVRGSIGRLTKACITHMKSTNKQRIITYVDERHGFGTSYMKAGWSLVEMTVPRFWWTDYTRRFNRFKFRADRTRGMTEQQVAEEAGVHRIYGCQNKLLSVVV